MQEKAKEPEIRFAGFTGAWEQRKLGNLGETYTGLSGKSKEDFGHGTAKFITYMNVYSNPVSDPEGTDLIEVDNRQNTVRKGDVLFTTSSETPEEVGMSSVVFESIENTYLNSFCFGYRPKIEFNNFYLAFLLRSGGFRKNIIFLAQGISRYNISKNAVMNIPIPIPAKEEQEAIGDFFKHLDALLTLHQRKYEKLLNIKKSMLEKMFPKEGEVVPEIRFKGFTGAWEQRKLNEIADVYDGVHQTPKYTSSGVRFLSVENIATLESEKYISEADFIRDFKIFPQKGDILMTRIGDIGTAKVIKSDEKYAFYVSLALLKPKHINSDFLCNSIASKNFQKGLKARSLLTAIPLKINKEEIGKVATSFPLNLSEQEKIGSFFNHIESLLTLHQRKLEMLKNVKQAFLEKMFV